MSLKKRCVGICLAIAKSEAAADAFSPIFSISCVLSYTVPIKSHINANSDCNVFTCPSKNLFKGDFDRVEEGPFFDFISEGIPNGSFEKDGLKGYATTGSVFITPQYQELQPTDKTSMVWMNTAFDPITGISTLTTDRFVISGGLNYLIVDCNFMGTMIFDDVKDLIELTIIDSDNNEYLVDAIPANLPMFSGAVISGYSDFTGWISLAIDVSAFSGKGMPVRFSVTLHGRGILPADIPGLLVDDNNPLDSNRVQGTGLLIDNIHLSGTGVLPLAVELNTLTIEPPANGASVVTGAADSVVSDSTVYFHGRESGSLHETVADADGAFSISVPVFDQQDTWYLLYYSTPKTTTDNSSNRLFSPNLTIKIPNE